MKLIIQTCAYMNVPGQQRMQLWIRLVCVICIVMLGGCSRTFLMTTPVIAVEGLIDPFEHVDPTRQGAEIPVFAASTRTVSGKPNPLDFYSNDRSLEVRLGLASIEIGHGMTWEGLVRESRVKKRSQNPEIRVAAFDEFGPLWSTAWPSDLGFHREWEAPGVDREPGDRFVEDIEALLESSRRRQITIFVHGFNTRFGDNLALTGEFGHYMGRDGVMISFDWPSKGSVFSYEVDKANANFAIRQFRELLRFLAANTSTSRINIIGHSAGCPIVVEALRQISLIHYELDGDEAQRKSKIGRVALAAPDMDLDSALSAAVDGAKRITQGLAVYASRKDKALGFSSDIFGDVRVGRSIGKLSDKQRAAAIANNKQLIDVTAAERRASSFTGHSYFHQNPWVSSDLMLYLSLGATPEERGLVRDLETGFLVFPDDYEDQLAGIAERLRAKSDAVSFRPVESP